MLISVFSFNLKVEFLKNKISDSEESVLCKNFLYKLRILNSASFPEPHMGLIEAWKLVLSLCVRRSLTTTSALRIYFIPIGLLQCIEYFV